MSWKRFARGRAGPVKRHELILPPPVPTSMAPAGVPISDAVPVVPSLAPLTVRLCPPPKPTLRFPGSVFTDEPATIETADEPALPAATIWIGALPWPIATAPCNGLVDELVTVESAVEPELPPRMI